MRHLDDMNDDALAKRMAPIWVAMR